MSTIIEMTVREQVTIPALLLALRLKDPNSTMNLSVDGRQVSIDGKDWNEIVDLAEEGFA
jgi:hypothetical protein